MGTHGTVGTPSVLADLECIHCGYNLRTLAWGGVCPECGYPVSDSRRAELSRFVSLEGVRWTQRGVALIAGAILLPTLARIVFVLLTLYMLPHYWYADRMSIPLQVYRWSGHSLGYTALASNALWAGAIIAIVLPRFPQARAWWPAAARVTAAAAVLSCVGLLYANISVLRQLAASSPLQRNLPVEYASVLVFCAAICAGWLLLGLRLPRANRRTRWLVRLGLLAVAGNLVMHLAWAIEAFMNPGAALGGGAVLMIEEEIGWRRALADVSAFWMGTAAPYKELVLLLGLWAYTRALRAAAALLRPGT